MMLIGFAAVAADKPSFKLLNRGMYYPASRKLAFPYSACGVTNLDIKVSKCYANNLNAYELKSYGMEVRMTKVAERHVELLPPYDETTNRMLPLGELLGKCEPGVYKLEIKTDAFVERGSDWWSWRERLKDSCFFALTDLGISVAVSPGKDEPKAMAMIHSLKDGKPVKGAEVTLLSFNNQMIGQGKTDKFGIVQIPFAPSIRIDEDYAWGVMATKGGDMSYLQLDGVSDTIQRDSYEQKKLNDVRAFLFAERDICRPGESFETGLFLRSSPQGDMKAVGNAPVDLELIDVSDNSIDRRRLTTDRWGFVTAKWDIPAAAKVGNWSVVARMAGHELGRLGINISAYVPDRFRVSLTADALAPMATNPPLFKGSAVYYFGENVTLGDWKFGATASLAPQAPHWKGWTCGTGEVPEISAFAASGEVSDGAFEARLGEGFFAKCRESKSPVLIETFASVTPPGARTVTAWCNLRYDPSDRYIGVREGSAKTRDVRTFDLTFLPAKAGDAAPSADADDTIAVKLIKHEWKSHAVEKDNGTFRIEWREEHTELPKFAREMKPGALAYPAKDLAAGSYTLVATTADGLETRFNFWHWEGEVSERSVSPAAIHLKADREKALPGDEVKLTFSSGHRGRAYFIAGERGMETTGTFAVKPGENSFMVRIRKDAVAKYTCVAVTVINENAPNARCHSGVAHIRVMHEDRKYPLELVLPETVRPGRTMNVKVKSDGAGAVRLMAVDEGVLALTGYGTPDIYSELYDYDYGSPFTLSDIYSQIYPDLKVLPNGKIGGGGFVESMKRKNVRTRRDSTLKQKETARVVLPLVEIPASGEATVAMTMPDFTGAMRVMAVAVDDRRAGSAADAVIVRDVASLFVNAPRFAVGGDTYELTAEVFNHDLPESDWTLEVDGRHFAGRLGKGASTNVAFRVTVPEGGNGVREISGTLKIGGETFRDSMLQTVRPKNPPIVETAYSVRRADAPKPMVDESSTNEWVRLDEDRTEECETPRAAIAGALKWLDGYPYGCLEQTAAMAFPFLAADDLLRIGAIDEATRSNAVVKVKAAYGEIMQMACFDGGFAMWPGGKDEWTDGTLFAMHFIFAAERQGWIKPDPRKKMIGWLRRKANGNDPKGRLDHAYAAYILALAGEDSFANAAKNVLASKEIDFASFLASAALIHGGYAAEGTLAYNAALAARVWETGLLPASDGWSRIRAYGMALTIIGMSPSAAEKESAPLVVKLIESLRGDGSAWGTTRDNAWACAGLARFALRDMVFSCRIRSGIPKEKPVHSDVLKVSRKFPERVKKGDLVEIEVAVDSPQYIDSAVICDLIPGGFELEDPGLRTRAKDGRAMIPNGRSEIRDDRWLWFGTIYKRAKDEKPAKYRYLLRAVTRGTFAVPALSAEDMYNPDVSGFVDATQTVTVE